MALDKPWIPCGPEEIKNVFPSQNILFPSVLYIIQRSSNWKRGIPLIIPLIWEICLLLSSKYFVEGPDELSEL